MATFTADEKDRLFDQLDEITRAIKGTNGTPGLLARMVTQEGKMKMLFAIGGGLFAIYTSVSTALIIKVFNELGKALVLINALKK